MNILNKISKQYRDIIEMVFKECINQQVKVYLVGGMVRDIILDIEPRDIDICVDTDPINIIKNLKEVKSYNYYKKFQTSNVLFFNGVSIDIIRCRKETYKFNGALPEVIPSHIYDDLYRRDFTINAIAYDLANNVFIDKYNGIEDINKKLVKEVHSNSYYEDPTRIFRAVRYASRYGFSLSDEKKIKKCLSSDIFKLISNDRLIKEVKLICSEESWQDSILTINNLKILSINNEMIGVKNELCNYDEINNRLLNLFISLVDEDQRYKFVNNSILDREMRIAFKNYKDLIINMNKNLTDSVSNFKIFKRLSNLNRYEISIISFEALFKYKIINYLKNFKNASLEITGDDLNSVKIKKGKQYKLIIDYLLEIKLNTGILNDREYFYKNIEEILNGVKYKD